MKIPKSLAVCADLLYATREKRLAAQKVVAAFEAEESALKEHIINRLPKSDATGISGKVATVRVEVKQIARVEDFDKLYAYVAKNRSKGAFALLQRRVNEAAVREIWESGKKVPGVSAMPVPVVSLTKR